VKLHVRVKLCQKELEEDEKGTDEGEIFRKENWLCGMKKG
jgi:hypothetical protein